MDSEFGRRSGFSLARVLINFLTTMVVLATLSVVAVFAAVFVNPQLEINPFPPPTAGPTLPPPPATATAEPTTPAPATATPTIEPSATPEPPTLEPTVVSETATPTEDPTGAPTEEPTEAVTEQPTEEPTSEPPATPTATAEPAEFSLQAGSPAAQQRWWPPYDELCEWMGIGGHVFDVDGKPIVGLGVHLEGELDGQAVELDTLTGSASGILGGSGYLFDLANEPIASEETLWLQLIDIDDESTLSDQVFITTYATCENNLILVNWRRTE